MRTSRLWAILAAFVLAMAATFAVACGDDDDETTTGGGAGEPQAAEFDLVNEGELLVGTDTPYPPFEIGQPPDISGYDIDITNEIAKRIGLGVTYQDTSFDTSRRDVALGKFDAVVAATTITPEREGAIDFTDPYYETEQALMVTPDSDIQSVEDLSGVTVGAQDGTTGETYANDETEAGEVRGYPEGPDAINALKAGQVDAVIIDIPVAEDAVEKQGGVEIATEIPTGEVYGIVVAEENDALREAMNEALAEMKSDGTFADIFKKYFKGEEPPKTVLNATHEPT